MHKKPKVIMLGWADKPSLNSGVGFACQSLSSALSEQAFIQMVSPKIESKQIVDEWDIETGPEEIEPPVIESPFSVSKEDKVLPTFIQAELPGVIDPYGVVQGPVYFSTKEKYVPESLIEPAESIPPNPPHENPPEVKSVMDFARFATSLGVRRDFDIIHAHDWPTFLPGMALKDATGKPLVLHFHSTAFDRVGPDIQDWTQKLEKVAVEKADLILVVSEYTASILIEKYGVSAEKIKVVHNGGIPPQNTGPENTGPEYTPISAAFVIGFAGRMTKQKGPEYFLKMAFELSKKQKNIRFVMLGDGPLRTSLINTVNDNGMGHLFYFPGFLPRKQFHSALKRLNLLVMPSISEPFGLVALEAAQLGLPCVLSTFSGVKEVLPGALVAVPWKVDELVAQVESLVLLEPEELKSLGEKIQKQASQATWEKAAEKVLNSYSSLLPHL